MSNRFVDDQHPEPLQQVELREQARQVVDALLATLTARIAEASDPAALAELRAARRACATELRQLNSADASELLRVLDEFPRRIQSLRAGREHG